MFLYDIYSPELIKVGFEAEDKEEAFEELVDHFCQVTNNSSREEILTALRDREAKMSTGIKKGIAIPHGRTAAVERVFGAIGISKKGIDYDSLDGEPVYILFMILAPETQSEAHLRALTRLAELLENPQFVTDLASQNDSHGAYAVIRNYEDILTALD